MKILFIVGGLATFRGTERMLLETVESFSSDNKILIWAYHFGGESVAIFQRVGFHVLIGKEAEAECRIFNPDIVNIHRSGMYNQVETDILRKFKDLGSRIIETSIFGVNDYSADGLIDLSLQISRWDLYRWNRRKGPFCRQTSIYLPNAVDTDAFHRAKDSERHDFRAQHNIPDDAFLLSRIGKTDWTTITPYLLKTLLNNPKCIFFSVDDYCGIAPEAIRLHPQFRSTPRLENERQLSLYYSSADAVLATSPIGESFGMVIAESMACETPVIAWTKPDMDNAQAELIQHGETGWLIKTPAELPNLVTAITSNKHLCASPKAIRNSIVSRYSRRIVSKRLLLAFSCTLMSKSRDELIANLKKNGFETDIPQQEYKRMVGNAIGKYPLIVRLRTITNVSYIARMLYIWAIRICRR